VSNYPPDPGGVFASDHHRRVAAHLPLPGEDTISVDELIARLNGDAFTALGESTQPEVKAILDDLSEADYARYLEGTKGWRLLKAGLEALTGPALTDVEEIDGVPTRIEPPPLEGARLEEAEAQQARIAEEDDAIEKGAAAAAVDIAKEQLAVAEAAAQKAGV
jgi:hypothetical protein